MGGLHRVLSAKFRLASVAAALILGIAAWIVLARADLVPPGAQPAPVRVATWVFAGFFSLEYPDAAS